MGGARLEPRTCPVCGKEFQPRSSKQKCCSRTCGSRARRAVDPADILGQRNGKCTVIGPAEPDRFGHTRIMLRCDCGTEFSAALTGWVRRNAPKMCLSCSEMLKASPERDRTGEQVGSLTILGREGDWRGEMPTRYRVRCGLCGSETVMDGAHLRYNTMCVYCARKKLDVGREIWHAADIDGTNTLYLQSALADTRAVNKNSSTGIRGVNKGKNGMYRAVIVLKRKQYDLGMYARKADAAAARKEAEKHLYGNFLTWYEAFRADKTLSERVVSAYQRKTKLGDIAEQEGISRYRVTRILTDAGVRTSKRTQEIQDLAASGMSREQIAEHLGIQLKAVDAHLPYMRGGTYTGNSATTKWRKSKEETK